MTAPDDINAPTNWVWLRNDETNGVQRFPVGAAPAWRVRGWVDCDAPVDQDPALVEHQAITAPEPPAEAADTDPAAEDTAEPTTSTTRKKG